ncbi:N-acetylmuramoyl-L-alanine amidase [Frankia sp. AgB32]|uniref:peptidoglycan recognition protein family protein n=1 Tax=Frankia sp. AgB32 TaxID=631119 RepID=UPI00200C3932|nr:N-acetylmuramoyl-L-alanine amidase [Frankia sp. AgB32]MCK9895760.1 N-acetylmuramoyl-L-alanine amidase [Frankia sp. AgB32]
MPATRYSSATYRPVRNSSGTMTSPTKGLIPHVQVGKGSLFGWFDNPASQVSSHLWLSRSGTLEQYVPFDKKAWAEAAGNPFWISVECEGFPNEDYTPIQLQRLGELYAWGMREFGWRPQVADSVDGFGIGTHRMGGPKWGGHSCPGDVRADRRRDILEMALGNKPDARGEDVPEGSDARQRYAGMPTLQEGSRGADVAELQNALNIVFHHETTAGDLARLAPDGEYGTLTTARVASLQRYASPWFGRIGDDGVCGPDTWRKIGYILTGLDRTV